MKEMGNSMGKKRHEPKKIFVIDLIFIHVIPCAHLQSVLTKIEVTSKLISPIDAFLYSTENSTKFFYMKLKILI